MRLVSSYEPNYFSVEDLIATNSTVPCRVEIQIPRLGETKLSAFISGSKIRIYR